MRCGLLRLVRFNELDLVSEESWTWSGDSHALGTGGFLRFLKSMMPPYGLLKLLKCW